MIFKPRSTGFSNDEGGYSGAFSWWRHLARHNAWWVADHTGFCERVLSLAVTDDFGNLVRVKD